ncbi:MAG: hypothetical protein FD123_348 [Bacteroidetes bacterium]|nr:MAG: hypothetical protein FD123_348 [Bacteroidota bacterium]
MTIQRFTETDLKNSRHICFFLAGFCLLLASCKSGAPATAYSGDNKGKTKTNPAGGNSVPKVIPTEELEQQAIFIDASREKMLGNYAEAMKLYERCISMNPKNAAAHYEVADLYSERSQSALALPHAKEAALLDPANPWYQRLYAVVLQQNYKFDEAASVLQKLTKTYPGKVEFLAEYADALLYANKPDEALKVFDRIEQITGPSEALLLQKFKILERKGDEEKIIKTLQELIDTNPKESRYYGMLGDYYQKTGKPEKAAELYNQLLLVDPENGYVHLSLSEYYRRQKDHARAFSEMIAAFRQPSVDIDTKVKILLNYYYATDNPERQMPDLKIEADSICKTLIRVHPDEAKAFSIYGDFLSREEKRKEAREMYRKALALDKNRFAIWNELLLLNSQLNDDESQLIDAKQAVELFPSQPTPYFFLGLTLIKKKQYQDAISNLQTGSAFVVDNNALQVQFYTAIGDAYNGLKKHDKSDEYFDKALVLDPDNAYVLNNYSYFLSLRNENLDKAETMIRKANRLEPNNPSYEDTYGWVLYHKGSFDEAKTWIEKALTRDAENGTLLEHYGDVLFRLGRTDDALTNWKKAKEKGGGSDFLDKKINDKKLYE